MGILRNTKIGETLNSLSRKEAQALSRGYGDGEYPGRRRQAARDGISYLEADHKLCDVLVQIVGNDIDESRPIRQQSTVEREVRRAHIGDGRLRKSVHVAGA